MKPFTLLLFALALASCARQSRVNESIGHTEITSAPDPVTPPEAGIDLHLVAGASQLCRMDASFPVERTEDAKLEHLAQCLRSDENEPATVVLIGRENRPGSYDVDLGLRRATRVKEMLVAGGVPEERIVATSSTEAAPPGSTRVDLVIAFPPPSRRKATSAATPRP
jgi:hypothetical protein